MGIGASIFLIAVGAIFAFAINADLGWLNINVVGWVLMLAGLVGLLTTLYFWNNRRRTVVHRPGARARAGGRRRPGRAGAGRPGGTAGVPRGAPPGRPGLTRTEDVGGPATARGPRTRLRPRDRPTETATAGPQAATAGRCSDGRANRRRSGEQREVDRDVVAGGGEQGAGVEELVVAEDGGPRVGPAQRVEDRADAVGAPPTASSTSAVTPPRCRICGSIATATQPSAR